MAVLPEAERHLLSRFSYGVTPGLAAEATAAGGGRSWFEQQLAVPTDDDGTADWFPELHLDPATLWKRQVDRTQGGWEVMWSYGRRLLMRRMSSPRQVLEVMTEFWESHLHVPAIGDEQFTWRAAYGDVIRTHALGSFAAMLKEAIVHPAMSLFLGNQDSTKTHPNENLGRELLELHTVGIGAYTEDDVKASARILTGYTVDMWKTFAAGYSPSRHATGPVTVMGFSSANAAADGRPVVDAYLDYLAHHPATGRHLATKLATKFVGEDPPVSLVTTLAQAYLTHDTAIAPMLRALVDSPEFAAAGPKLRTPTEDIIATYRVTGTTFARPTSGSSAVVNLTWIAQDMGQAPMAWPRPDGDPIRDAAWATPSRAIGSTGLHANAASGWWPSVDISYRPVSAWLPSTPVTLAGLVDHVAQQVHHRPADPALVAAVCTATQQKQSLTIKPTDKPWWFNRLLWTVLDHPYHYAR